jgi:hypothetical protein
MPNSANFAYAEFCELRLNGVLRSSALWLVPELLAITAHRLRPRDQGAQPYPSRGVSRDDVAEVVHPKVHTAEAYKHHQQRRSADHRHASLPASQGDHEEVGQHPVGDEGLHRVAAWEGVARLDHQGVSEVGAWALEDVLQQPVDEGAAGHRRDPGPEQGPQPSPGEQNRDHYPKEHHGHRGA